MNYNQPILITGVERSGGTLIAKIISIAGGVSGITTSMLENKEIRKEMEKYFQQIDGEINLKNQFPLPDSSKLPLAMDWEQLVLDGVSKDKIQNKIWFYKSPRICQVWPIWNNAFPEAKWIIVRRRAGDIVNSCLHTAFMHSYTSPWVRKQIGVDTERDGWVWWVRQHEKYFEEIQKNTKNCMVIWPERMVQGDYSQIVEMLNWLGLNWVPEIVNQIEPLLWKAKRAQGGLK